MSLFSIRMRASAQADGAHLCGAECIADAAALTERCQSLVERALMHERGKAGKITLTVEPLNKAEIIHLNALPVTTRRLPSVEAAWEQAIELLQSLGIARAREAAVFFSTAYNMRGAMLVDADTLERLESDKSRGIRVTRMDAAPILQAKPAKTAFKNHFREALVLATKAANAPGIIAELCVSDDPNYQTGYIASKKIGYVRLTPLKERGDTRGGRILFFRQAPEADDCISACIDYLQRQPVLVCGIPDNPPAPDAGHKWQAIQAGNFGITEQECFEIYKKIGIIANKHTGEKAVFVKSAFNKIIHHKGFDKRIIAVLDQLFINAWKMYDEPVNTAHKIHTNFSKYSHYAAKVLLDEKEVYTRITLQTLKTKPWKQEINEFHSVHLSYEVKSDARRPRVNSSIISLATWGVEGTTDVKLQNWLNSVNPFINDNIHSQPPDAGHKWQALKDALAEKKQERCYRETRLMENAAGAAVRYKGREFIMLASNNYLNLAGDSRLGEAAARAAAIYGWGAGGSRLTTGTMPPHQELEEALAKWKGTESALLFNTGYMANVGVISALCSTKGGGGTDGGGTCREWTIFSDANNHASIIDGCRLSGARIAVYRHNDMDDLEAKAAAVYAANGNAKGLIVSDSVFSMDGDIVDLPRFVDIAARYGFLSMIDEAHGSGCIGKTGRGVTELFGVKPDIITGTCSKALGSEGGFVCGSSLLIDFLVNHARSFIFATAPPPPVAAATLAALRIIQTEPELTRRLQSNIRFFCELLRLRGIPANSSTAIIPIIIGDEEKALAASDFLLEEGFFVPAIRYPTVPKGEAMLRAVVCRAHTEEQLDNAAAAIAKIYTPYKPNRKTGTMNSGG